MRLPIACVTMLVLLAGCSNPVASPNDVADAPGGSASATSTGPAPPAQPTIEVIPVSFDGNLGTMVHGCVFVPATTCDTRVVVPEGDDLSIARDGANLTALELTVTWTAATPATATLAFGAMVMGDCEGCSSEFDFKEGVSPLTLTGTGLSFPLNQTVRVHVYGYNPNGLVTNDAFPGYGVLSVEQDYHIEGTVTVLVPPA
jgi:hypothetical protein